MIVIWKSRRERAQRLCIQACQAIIRICARHTVRKKNPIAAQLIQAPHPSFKSLLVFANGIVEGDASIDRLLRQLEFFSDDHAIERQ